MEGKMKGNTANESNDKKGTLGSGKIFTSSSMDIQGNWDAHDMWK